jgi:hypothetical protein
MRSPQQRTRADTCTQRRSGCGEYHRRWLGCQVGLINNLETVATATLFRPDDAVPDALVNEMTPNKWRRR